MSDEFDEPRRFYKWSEVKWARSVGDDSDAAMRQANDAWAAGKRMIARGERPMYRVDVVAKDEGFQLTVVELPWLTSTVTGRREVLPMARDRIADWLRADADAFDVELASSARGVDR
jgi:hypothetical protein